VLWKGALAIGGETAAAMAIVTSNINEEGSPKTKARFALTLHSIPCFLKEESVKNKMLIN
jgi:hypothetical protein